MEVNIGLDAPIPLELLQELMSIEEARVEAAHVPVRQAPAVDDPVLLHLPAPV